MTGMDALLPVATFLPAIIALVAWGEGGHRLLRQFGARMLWEVALLVVVGLAILLQLTMRVMADDWANLTVVVVIAMCAVAAVTGVTHRFVVSSPLVRAAISAGAAVIGSAAGLALGVFVYFAAK
jgi:hypothetical protein